MVVIPSDFANTARPIELDFWQQPVTAAQSVSTRGNCVVPSRAQVAWAWLVAASATLAPTFAPHGAAPATAAMGSMKGD